MVEYRCDVCGGRAHSESASIQLPIQLKGKPLYVRVFVRQDVLHPEAVGMDLCQHCRREAVLAALEANEVPF